MKKNTAVITRILGILCALLMLAVVVLQFLPAWQLDEESLTIAEYVWNPHKHTDFTKFFRAELLDDLTSAGDIAGGHAIMLVGCLVGAIYCLLKPNKRWVYVLGAVVGVFGAVEYFMQPLYVLTGLGIPLLILSAAVAVVSIAGLVLTWLGNKE